MNEDKSTRYHRLRRRAGLLSAVSSVLLQIVLVSSSTSVTLRDLAGYTGSALTGDGTTSQWLVVAVYVTCLAVLHEILALPFAVYRGYLVERRYGLSRDRFPTWLLDHVKAVLAALCLGLIGSELLYASIRARPSDWWIAAGVVFSLGMGVLVHVAPVLLLPIFHRVSPLGRDALRARLASLAERTRCRVVDVYEWHLGDRSRRANAALVGLGRTRRILVSDTLLAEYSDDEIEAILGHELGHHVHRDIWRSMASESAFMFAGFLAAFHALRALGPGAGLKGPQDVAGLPLVLLAVGLVSVLLMPLANALSRHAERRADRFALKMASRPEAFASAIRRLAAQNLAEEDPSWIVRVLFYTHPPIRERLAAAASSERRGS